MMTFRKLIPFLVPVLFALNSFAQAIIPVEDWTVDLDKPTPKSVNITRGESRHLQPTVKDGTEAWVFPTNVTVDVTMYYKSSDMTNAYYTVTGAVQHATAGVLRVTWKPAQEATAKAYSFEIKAATGTTAQISVYGSIFLKDSLTTVGSVTNPAYTVIFNWNAISNQNVTNGPWISSTNNIDTTARTTANYATNWIALTGNVSVATGTNALTIATNAYNQATNALVIATNAYVYGTNAYVIATNALQQAGDAGTAAYSATNFMATNTYAADTTNAYTIATNALTQAGTAQATGTNGVTIATNALAQAQTAQSTATNGVTIATNALTIGTNALAQAQTAQATGTNGVTIATNAYNQATNALAIAQVAFTNDNDTLATVMARGNVASAELNIGGYSITNFNRLMCQQNSDIDPAASDIAILAGQNNTFGGLADWSAVLAGENNTFAYGQDFCVFLGSTYGTIGGSNALVSQISSQNAVIGDENFYATLIASSGRIASNLSYVIGMGRNPVVSHSGSFVFSDGQAGAYESTAANTFNVRAAGGINFLGEITGSGSGISNLNYTALTNDNPKFTLTNDTRTLNWTSATVRVATPSTSPDAANKGYVDDQLDLLFANTFYGATNEHSTLTSYRIFTNAVPDDWTQGYALDAGTNAIGSRLTETTYSFIPAGQYQHMVYMSENGAGTYTYFSTLIAVSTDGATTNTLGTASLAAVEGATVTPYVSITHVSSNWTFASPVYLGVLRYAVRTGGGVVTLTVYGGTSYPTHLNTPTLASSGYLTQDDIAGITNDAVTLATNLAYAAAQGLTNGFVTAAITNGVITNASVNGVNGTVTGQKAALNLIEDGSAITNMIFWANTEAAYGALATTNASTVYFTW